MKIIGIGFDKHYIGRFSSVDTIRTIVVYFWNYQRSFRWVKTEKI